jgi:hypothetical protein
MLRFDIARNQLTFNEVAHSVLVLDLVLQPATLLGHWNRGLSKRRPREKIRSLEADGGDDAISCASRGVRQPQDDITEDRTAVFLGFEAGDSPELTGSIPEPLFQRGT